MGPTAVELQLLSADASASVQDVGLTAKVEPQSADNLLSLTSPVGTVSLDAPKLTVEGGLSTPIGDVSVALPDSPGLDLPSLVSSPGGSSPPAGGPSFSGGLPPSGAAGALPRSGATARMSPALSPQDSLSNHQGQLGRTNDLVDPRGPADPARAGPFGHAAVPLDSSSVPQSQPSVFAGTNPSLASPLPATHAPAGGAPGSASASAGTGAAAVGLLATFALARLLTARRFQVADFFRRPILFIALLERPG